MMKKQLIIITALLVLAVVSVKAEYQVIAWGYSKSSGNLFGQNWMIGGIIVPCTASWNCSVYSECNITDGLSCTSVIDLNSCGGNFTGDYGDYDDNCTFCDTHTTMSICEGRIMWDIAVILLPVIFGFFCLLGAIFMGKEHDVLKIGMYLLSLVSVLGSLHLASVVIGTTNSSVQSALGVSITWIGWILFVVIIYFLIYAIYKMGKSMQQKKDDKLNY